MKDITLNKDEFKLFNQFDQFGFFYDDDGFPKANSDANFDTEVEALYATYESIIIDSKDNVWGMKNGKKEIILESLIEAYDIALEVTQY